MDKTLVTFIGGTLIVAFVFFAVANAVFLSGPKINAAAVALPAQNPVPAGEVQVVNLSAQGINYTPSVITVKQNQPVKIVANVASLQGCLKSFVIPKLGLKKVFNGNDNVLEFTPTQSGTFDFSCSMGMGRGKLVVVP